MQKMLKTVSIVMTTEEVNKRNMFGQKQLEIS